MSDAREAVHDVARALGIDTQYWDWRGAQCDVSADTLRAVLTALGVDPDDRDACAEIVRRHADERVLPATVTARVGRGTTIPADDPVTISLEDGGTLRVPAEGGIATLPDDLPIGYHEVRAGEAHTHLIVSPERLELPADLGERPGWGLATQLYSVRSRNSWGVGDLGDLRSLSTWTARDFGADFVLVNPVHAGDVVTPLDPSPYLPTSRRFANPIYLRIDDIPEFAGLTPEEQDDVMRPGASLRGTTGERIERDPAWAAKLSALGTMFGLAPPSGERAAEFADYRANQGDPLTRFATWCALCEAHGNDWRDWPAELRDPASENVATFAAEHAGRVEFWCWVQWLTEEQLRAVQHDAVGAGMRIGVVHDVAVGVSPSGADAWANQDSMATSVTVGAPPDAYSQLGQDWQQPPWRPDRLAQTGYRPFREMFAAAFAHCGGLRVDHIIGLFRLWWIPRGREALEGTYVHYDHDALIGVLLIEAQRAGAVVVGEDLGNVEPFAHDYLRERGLLGTSILWFENDRGTGEPLPAAKWRELCLASVTTHDLPPTAGYLAGDHVRLRDSLHLLTRSVEDELAASEDEQRAWLDLLRRKGLLSDGAGDTGDTGGSEDVGGTEQIVLALHRFLLGTPSRLRLVALTDAVGDRATQNQPGTRDEYPNWRVPLAGPDGEPVLLEDVRDDARVHRLLSLFTRD